MRSLLLAVALLACGASKPTGPAWPEPSKTAEDGGESLEPRPSAAYAAALETKDEKEPAEDKAVEEKAAEKPADDKAEEKPAEKPEAQTPASDEVIMTEEIIIEIED